MAKFTFKRGDTIKLTTQILGANGAPLDLTGAKVWWTMKRSFSDLDASAIAQVTTVSSTPPGGGITVTNAAEGRIAIKCPAEATSELTAATHEFVYDIQVKDAVGDIATAETGEIKIEPDVTRATT